MKGPTRHSLTVRVYDDMYQEIQNIVNSFPPEYTSISEYLEDTIRKDIDYRRRGIKTLEDAIVRAFENPDFRQIVKSVLNI